MDFAKKGFYVTRGGWKAEVIHVADGKLVVRHYAPDTAPDIERDEISIHAIDGTVCGSKGGVSIEISKLVGPWDESGITTDALCVIHIPGRIPRFELGSRIPNRLVTDLAASAHKFRVDWDPQHPETLQVEKLP